MFSGIVYCTGKIRTVGRRASGRVLTVEAGKPLLKPEKGMSIAVNGACLTATAFRGPRVFLADVSEETCKKTTLGNLRPSSKVNIEFPLTLDTFLSGHIVQGHVDCSGEVAGLAKVKSDNILTVKYPPEFDRYIVDKGSVTVDGTSLTAYNIRKGMFEVSLIPETMKGTIASGYKRGTKVNLEFDIIGKYVIKQLRK